MSLKIALALIVAVMVAHSAARVAKQQKDDTVPGFVFKLDNLSLETASGKVDFSPFPFSHNVTAWKYSKVNGIKSISAKLVFLALSVRYSESKATVNGVKTSGTLVVLSWNSEYTTTFKVGGDVDNCKLDVEVKASKMAPYLVTADFGENRDAFERDPVVKKALKSKVVEILSEPLSEVVTWMLKDALQGLFNVDKYCKKLLASSAEKYSEPNFASLGQK